MDSARRKDRRDPDRIITNPPVRFLDSVKGHRTFILVCVVVLPFSIKGLLIEGSDYATTLQFIGQLLRDALFGYSASKGADAFQTYARRNRSRDDHYDGDRVRYEPDDGYGITEG
jgi:hypothetical protein